MQYLFHAQRSLKSCPATITISCDRELHSYNPPPSKCMPAIMATGYYLLQSVLLYCSAIVNIRYPKFYLFQPRSYTGIRFMRAMLSTLGFWVMKVDQHRLWKFLCRFVVDFLQINWDGSAASRPDLTKARSWTGWSIFLTFRVSSSLPHWTILSSGHWRWIWQWNRHWLPLLNSYRRLFPARAMLLPALSPAVAIIL